MDIPVTDGEYQKGSCVAIRAQRASSYELPRREMCMLEEVDR